MTTSLDVTRYARDLDVDDALVFRRIGATMWAHVGGIGRGKGWAGIVDIDERDDELATRIPRTVGEIYRLDCPEPGRVLGPYYAASSAVARVSENVAVVLGSLTKSLANVSDLALLDLAYRADHEIPSLDPSKRLADELEVLTAVRDLMSAPVERGLSATQRYLTATTTTALTCDIGVSRDSERNLTVVGESDVPTEAWHRALDELVAITEPSDDEEWCLQDMSSPAAAPIAAILPQARSLLLTRTEAMDGGLLLLIHTDDNPRGFSAQCRRMCQSLVETGLVIAKTAALRDNLRDIAEQAGRTARTDPLTGLGNRLAWDEAIGRAQEAIDNGASYAVISVDVDGLKNINDRYGHPAGDALLQRCADIIRAHSSPHDLAVRMGGDEFAILVPHALSATSTTFTEFTKAFAQIRSTRENVAASVGVCTAGPGDSLFDALREADMRMYADKRKRRLAAGEVR